MTRVKKKAARSATQPVSEELHLCIEELKRQEKPSHDLQELLTTALGVPRQVFYLYDYTAQDFIIGKDQIYKLYGYEPHEVLRLKGGWTHLIHPDDLAGFLHTSETVRLGDSNQLLSQRMRVRRKEGRYEWIQWHVRVYQRSEKGEALSELGHVRVITSLVEAENAKHELEARYRMLFENSSAGILIFDDHFVIHDANPALCRMIGHKVASLRRLEVSDIAAPGARSQLKRILKEMKNCQCHPTAFDTVLEHVSGKRIEVQCSPTCLKTVNGNLCMLLITDMTQRNQDEQQARRAATLNRILLDNAPICIGLLDVTGRILQINRTTEKIFGATNAEVEGQNLWSRPIFRAEDIPASKKRFAAVIKGKEKARTIHTLRSKDGQPRIIDSQTIAVPHTDGGADFMVITGLDITEQRRLEAEVIRVSEQEQIRIGHELHDSIGQSLTGLYAMTQSLALNIQGEAQKDAQRIHELTGAALEEVRRLSHGLSPAAVRRGGLAGGLILLAESIKKDYRRKCVCRISPNLKIQDEETEIHLLRIAQEAVSNAIRHGNASEIRISLRRQDRGHLAMEIVDDGCGLGAKKDTSASGEGIGIRVMAYRATLIGGSLSVKPASGRGVRVSCLFPDHFLKPGLLTKSSTPVKKKHREK